MPLKTFIRQCTNTPSAKYTDQLGQGVAKFPHYVYIIDLQQQQDLNFEHMEKQFEAMDRQLSKIHTQVRRLPVILTA